MARIESDREDLIREATALQQRVEWAVPGEPEPVVTGFKRDGSLSVYFGQDPVYQFNPTGQLRRAYVEDFLFRTQGDTLARPPRPGRRGTRRIRDRDACPTGSLEGEHQRRNSQNSQTGHRPRLTRFRHHDS